MNIDFSCPRERGALHPDTQRRARRSLALLIAAVLAGVGVQCVAAEATTGAAGAPATAAAAAPTPAAAVPQTLQPIAVYGARLSPADGYLPRDTSTATGTLTPLIDIPLSIQAIPIKLLKDQGARNLEDTMRNAPGVSIHQGEGNRDQFVIRGISTKSDFFLNGMRDDTEYFRDLYNVQEVDVLQGPSALLFGRGNAGGVINIVTKKPVRESIANLNLALGSWNELRGTVDVGGTMGPNAAWRVNAVDEHSDGYRQYFELRRWGVNPTFGFWFGDNTELQVGLEHFDEWQRADRGIPSQNGRPADVPRSRFFGSPTGNYAKNKIDAFNLRLDHAFSEHLHFRDMFRYNRDNKFYQNMYPGSAVAPDGTLTMSGYNHANVRNSYQNQAQLIADFDTGAVHHELLLGADYTYQHDTDVANSAKTFTNVPVGDPVVPWVYAKRTRDNLAAAHETGIYAQDQIAFGDQWLAVVGARWDRFTLDAHYLMLPPGNATRHTDNSWSPRVGLIYKPVPNDSIYVSATKSFTPQGANLALSAKSPVGQNLSPQKSVNYELGNKLDLLDGKLAFTAALFQLELTNITANDPNDPLVLVQTGKQRARGLELTLNGELTPRWNVAANYSRVVADIVQATSSAAVGAKVGLVPHNQASLWTTYALNDHWGIGGGLYGQSRVYTSFSNQVILPGYVTAQAMAYYQNRNYRVQLNLDNLANRKYYVSANGDNQIMPGAPLNAQVRFSLNF